MDRRTEIEARAERLKKARVAAGYPSARQAAYTNGWTVSTYTAHEAGVNGFDVDFGRQYARKYRVDLNWLMLGEEQPEDERHFIPVMGRVGAGGDVEPDYEQVPFDGLEQIELAGPLGLVADPVGFRVTGDSMHPRFKDGELIVCEREPSADIASLIGEEAVVVIYNDGGAEAPGHRRMVKRIMPGPKPHTYTLESLDPSFPPMIGVRLRWASPVRMLLPVTAFRRAARQARKTAAGKRAGAGRQE